MTNREAQIFQWISENPMISQEELAAKAGIKRSSVAVHISNLMRKGYIKGKGYITNEPSYCTVVGAANIDIGGVAADNLVPHDSNPGKVRLTHGGVGRNIAHNMRLLGIGAKLITALGDDLYAHRIMEGCNTLGIDISDALRCPEESTSICVYISEKNTQMAMAISDMDIYKRMTPEFMGQKIDVINHGRLVILDSNIPYDTLELIAEKCKVPIYADPINAKKAVRLSHILDRLHTLVMNWKESEVLCGIEVTDEATAARAAQVMLERGVKHVYVILQNQGVYAATSEEAMMIEPRAKHIVNIEGAREAFMAGLVLAYTRHLQLRETVIVGLEAAGIAMESADIINSALTMEDIAARAGLEM